MCGENICKNGRGTTISYLYYGKKHLVIKKSIESAEVEKVGFEKFFYDISGFDEKDIKFYNQFLKHVQKMN